MFLYIIQQHQEVVVHVSLLSGLFDLLQRKGRLYKALDKMITGFSSRRISK